MKKVVWSETLVDGGRTVEQQLRPLPDVAGPYQDCPRWGADPDAHRFAQDWIVVAVPFDETSTVLTPATVSASGPIGDWSCTGRRQLQRRRLARTRPGRSVDRLDRAGLRRARSRRCGDGRLCRGRAVSALRRRRMPCSRPATMAATYHVVADLPPAAVVHPDRRVLAGHSTPISPCAYGDSAASALPRLAHRRHAPAGSAARVRVRRRRVRTLARWPRARGRAEGGLRRSPRLLRSGFLNGNNGDRPVADRRRHRARRRGRHAALGCACRARGGSCASAPRSPADQRAGVAGGDRSRGGQARRWQGSPLPHDVSRAASSRRRSTRCSATASSRVRRTSPTSCASASANCAATTRCPGCLRLLATSSGTRPVPIDSSGITGAPSPTCSPASTTARSRTKRTRAVSPTTPRRSRTIARSSATTWRCAATPTCRWARCGCSMQEGKPAPTYVADLKGASSVAHVYGKPFTGAESMTAFHRPWSYTPRRLKHVADLELALGVTRFCIHTSPHQPTQVPPPGIGLSPYLGQTFIRTEPWAELAGPWIDYLARCSYLLNQGVPAVDVAVFVGEEAPLTSLFGDETDRSVPSGCDFDYVDLDALEDPVQRGRRRAGRRDVALPRALPRRLEHSNDRTGAAPDRVTRRRRRHRRRLADPLGRPRWPTTTGSTSVSASSYGRPGRSTRDLADSSAGPRRGTRARRGRTPTCCASDVGSTGPRSIFLANPHPEPVTVTLQTTSAVSLDAWDPVAVRREAVRDIDGRCEFSLPALRFGLPGPGRHR